MNKSGKRILMLGLDGCEPSIADAMMAAGRLPALADFIAGSARYRLDHGDAKRTGLAWEHVSSGLSPDDAERWAAVDFDPNSYEVRQRPTNLMPFVAGLETRSVIVDAPYFDLAKTAGTQGFVGWGAHDPGVAASYRPAALEAEIRMRFGDYAAPDWIYGFVWPSRQKAQDMAEALVRATEQRAAIASWLLRERLADWDLGLIVVSEFHSAIEALWHGLDPTHPLHEVASAEPARAGIQGVYEACDRMIASLVREFPDAHVVVFNLHGMGANNSDVPSMVLLAELLYRRQFRRPLMRARNWPTTAGGVPLLAEHEDWGQEVNRLLRRKRSRVQRLARSIQKLLASGEKGSKSDGASEGSLGWMPAARYQRYWRDMRAFALPSFYDGRIRINLKGREAKGLVDLGSYQATCDELIRALYDCRDPISGEPAVQAVERNPRADPREIGASEADLIVTWSKAAPLGLAHPDIGCIGPLPYRRTGGHTGHEGFAYLKGPGIAPGDFGLRSAFDVVPTVLALLDIGVAPRVSGRSLLQAVA